MAASALEDPQRARLPLARLLFLMGGVYTVQSTVGAMMFQGVPTVLRSSGAALDMIGLVSLFMVPWALKFLWSPFVEGWRIPVTGPRRSRVIIVTGQVIIAALLVVLALHGIEQGFGVLFIGFGVIALIAATVDIAGDGFMIEQLKPEHRGWGNVIQVGGGYAGIMIGTGLFLVLVDQFGWLIATVAMAGIACFLTAPFLTARDISSGDGAEEHPRPSLRNAFARSDIRWGLLTILVSQMGLRMITVMTGPFLIDNGLSASTIGILTGTIGTALCIVFIVLSGLAIRRWTARRTLSGMLILQILSFGLFTLFALAPQQDTVLSGLFLLQSAIIAGSFVALYTVIMDWTSAHQAGTDFTIFQCTDALVSVFAGFGSGIIAEHFGYGICFGIATGFAASALALLPFILRRTNKDQSHAG